MELNASESLDQSQDKEGEFIGFVMNLMERFQKRKYMKNVCSMSFVCVHIESLELCPTLFDHMDCSPLGASVHGILQARILERVAMTCSRGFSRPRDQTQVSCIVGGFFIAKPPEKPATISNIHFILHYSPHNFHSLFPLRILFRVLVL